MKYNLKRMTKDTKEKKKHFKIVKQRRHGFKGESARRGPFYAALGLIQGPAPAPPLSYTTPTSKLTSILIRDM
jgi:hypothetical protein